MGSLRFSNYGRSRTAPPCRRLPPLVGLVAGSGPGRAGPCRSLWGDTGAPAALTQLKPAALPHLGNPDVRSDPALGFHGTKFPSSRRRDGERAFLGADCSRTSRTAAFVAVAAASHTRQGLPASRHMARARYFRGVSAWSATDVASRSGQSSAGSERG